MTFLFFLLASNVDNFYNSLIKIFGQSKSSRCYKSYIVSLGLPWMGRIFSHRLAHGDRNVQERTSNDHKILLLSLGW